MKDHNGIEWLDNHTQISWTPEPEYCGVYWIITTCLTGIALGIGLGALAWMVLRVWE